MNPKKDEELPKEYIQCGCGTHLIQAECDEEYHEVYLAFFSHGHVVKPTIGYKLRTIWRVLTKGTPFSDSVCLDVTEQKKFIDYLQSAYARCMKPPKEITDGPATERADGKEAIGPNNHLPKE